MKNRKIILGICIACLLIGVIIIYFVFNNSNCEIIFKKLPIPEVADGYRGTLGIDKNVNEWTIDSYLGRSDTVYIDVRFLKDVAEWGNVTQGDTYLSGFVKGFEVIPYPYLASFTEEYASSVTGMVGNLYDGRTLFTDNGDGTYTENYEESLEILEYYFPKDKNIFIMCGGGGYAGQTKTLLVALGWNQNKLYNAGGYWYYNGNNNVEVKTNRSNETTYDFWKVKYHEFNFDELHEVQ